MRVVYVADVADANKGQWHAVTPVWSFKVQEPLMDRAAGCRGLS